MDSFAAFLITIVDLELKSAAVTTTLTYTDAALAGAADRPDPGSRGSRDASVGAKKPRL